MMAGRSRNPTRYIKVPILYPATLLVLSGLLLAGLPAVADVDPHRLGEDVRPLRQEVWLEINADREDYRGRTTLEIEITRPMAAFRMHAQDMELSSIRLEGEGFEGELLHRADQLGLVILSAPKVLAEGRYRLTIEFGNRFATNGVGLYRSVQGGQGYVFSQMQDVEARHSFPCFDEPGFKYPWQFTVRTPEEYLVVHNTPAVEESVSDGWRETVFAETKPLPSYLVALASGPFATVDIPELGVPARVILMPGQEPLARAAVELTGPILAELEDYFGESYPYEKLDFIAAPDFWYGAMENPGAVVFRDSLLLADPERPSVGQRRRLARVIAHELAHMWFGNLVTMAWWDDLWLNEAFADWLGTTVADRLFPSLGIVEQAYVSTFGPMRSDGRASAQPIRSHYGAGDDFTRNLALQYHKGKRVLAMFEHLLGREAFRDGLRAYIDANRWGSARADDLWRALAEETDSDIHRAIAGFIEQPGLPLLRIDPTPGGIRLSQRRYAPHGVELPEQHWEVPVGLRYSVDGTVHEARLLLGAEPLTLELPQGTLEWVAPNAAGKGYYHWWLPPGQLAALIEAPLEPLEQAEMLGNLAALLDAGELDGARYLESLRASGERAEGVVLDQLLARLEALIEPFGPQHNGAAFRRFLRATLGPAMERIGALPRPGEPEAAAAVRPRLLALLGIHARDAAVGAFAAELAQQYLEDPASLDPELATAALEVYVRRGDAELQEDMMRRAADAPDPVQRNVFLTAVASFHAEPLQQAALDYALSDALRPNEKWLQLWRAAGIPGRRDALLDWLFANYEAVTDGLTPIQKARIPAFADGCSIGRLARARQFFADPVRRVAGTEDQLERVADSVRQCAALQQREAERVSAWLSQGSDTG
jgi:cytosol alanyl aminopeptidase